MSIIPTTPNTGNGEFDRIPYFTDYNFNPMQEIVVADPKVTVIGYYNSNDKTCVITIETNKSSEGVINSTIDKIFEMKNFKVLAVDFQASKKDKPGLNNRDFTKLRFGRLLRIEIRANYHGAPIVIGNYFPYRDGKGIVEVDINVNPLISRELYSALHEKFGNEVAIVFNSYGLGNYPEIN